MASRVNSWPTAAPLDGTEIVACEHSNTYKAFTASELATYTQAASSVQLVTTLTSAAIQTAIDTAAAAGGGIVQLVEGDYVVSDFIEVKDNVTLRGVGKGATVLEAASVVGNAGGFAIGVVGALGQENVVIEDLTVDLVTNTIGTNGIALLGATSYTDTNNCTNCTIQRCEVLLYDDEVGPSGYAIWNRGATGTRILNNVVIGTDTALDLDSQCEGIEIFGGYEVLVEGNRVVNVGNAGIFVTTTASSDDAPNERITVTGNHIQGCAYGVKNFTTGTDTLGNLIISEGVTITNNFVKDCFQGGIHIEQSISGAAASDITAKMITVANNTIEVDNSLSLAGNYSGLALFNSATGTGHGVWQDVVVTGNKVRGGKGGSARGSAFYVYRCENFMAKDNVFSGDSQTGSDSTHLVYVNLCTDFQLSDNIIYEAYRNTLTIQASDRYVVAGNLFYDTDIKADGKSCVNLIGDHSYGAFVNNLFNPRSNTDFMENDAGGTFSAMTLFGNRPLKNQSGRVNEAWPSGSDHNTGLATIADTASSVTVSSDLIREDHTNGGEGTHVIVTQATQGSGSIEPFTVAVSDGQFVITRNGTTGANTYRYCIVGN